MAEETTTTTQAPPAAPPPAEQDKPFDRMGQAEIEVPPQETASLIAAIVAAQGAARAVHKLATNTYHNYKYASAEAIIAEARGALNACGLACCMTGWKLVPPTNDIPHLLVLATFKTYHGPSGGVLDGEITYPAIPDKGRPLDKAVAGALTYAEGYYLRGLLCLPRVASEIDVDQRDDTDFKPEPRGRREAPGSGRDPEPRKRGTGSGAPPRNAAGQGNAQAKPPASAAPPPDQPLPTQQKSVSFRRAWEAIDDAMKKLDAAGSVPTITRLQQIQVNVLQPDRPLTEQERRELCDRIQGHVEQVNNNKIPKADAQNPPPAIPESDIPY